MLFQLPRTSRVHIALQPANQWGWNEVLLNRISHGLDVLAWQKTKDATKKAPSKMPKMFVPDFMKTSIDRDSINDGLAAQDVESIQAILDKPRT